MQTAGGNYKGCAVQIYDQQGNLVTESLITKHDAKLSEIELTDFSNPNVAAVEASSGLRNGAMYRVRILHRPVPHEYVGIAILRGGYRAIVLSRAEASEIRRSPHYKVNGQGMILSLIYDNKAYELLKPLCVQIVNISQGGVRVSAASNTLSVGDSFELSLLLSAQRKFLIAKVINSAETGPGTAEYGCVFLAKGRVPERVK